jgi:virulence-associated protein VapD
MRRAGREHIFSRREVLGLLTVAGGTFLIAACGGSAPTATSTAPAASGAPSAAPSAAASGPASVAASVAVSQATGATPGASGAASSVASGAGSPTSRPITSATAIPRGSGTPGAASAAPYASAGTDLGRMLATVPLTQLDGSGPFPANFHYSNIRQQLVNYGFGEVTASASLSQQRRDEVNRVISALPLTREANLFYPSITDEMWRAAVGYDFWQVDRSLEWSRQWTRLEGRLDRDRIAQALVASGRTPRQYREGTIYSFGPDNAFDNNDPIAKALNIYGGFGRVTLEEAALTSHAVTSYAEGVIDVRAERRQSILALPEYDALAFALDPAVGAMLYLPGIYYLSHDASGKVVPPGTPVAGADRLPEYRMAGVGLVDDGKTQTMLFALVYPTAGEAQAAAPIFQRRLANYKSRVYRGRMLWEPAAVGEPRLVAAASRTVLVQPIAVRGETQINTWLNLMLQADFFFFHEYMLP